MTLWFVFAMMTAAAIFAVVWPLGRGKRAQREGTEATVYKDQLAEVERDVAVGLIGPSEAEAAKVEIGRRLLSAADEAQQAAPTAPRPGWRRAVAVVALIGLPVLAVSLYLPLGSPQLPDFPLAERSRTPSATEPLENLIAKVEAHLEKNPTDARGWTVLAPVLVRLGRYDDAARAYRNILTYGTESAERHSDLGEALTNAAGGVITADAKAAFERALVLDAGEVKARYFTGLAAEQDGRSTDAASIWRAMLEKAPADVPWRPMVQAALARVTGQPAPGPSSEAIAASKDMSEAERTAMIQGMVDRLAARLKQNSDDVEGWLRLARAYMVMGDRDKANGVLTEARQALGGNAERLQQLDAGSKNLGLGG
uniref:Tetratricopeptide TPR_2 n=1 Tax=Rhodopseudomonas palustris (strain BisA53) TaxID=316055 RepID=Q07QA8_RHOP5